MSAIITTTWQSVADTVPDDEMLVLICCPAESEPVWIGYKEGHAWLTAEGQIVAVTHWMELPEPIRKCEQ